MFMAYLFTIILIWLNTVQNNNLKQFSECGSQTVIIIYQLIDNNETNYYLQFYATVTIEFPLFSVWVSSQHNKHNEWIETSEWVAAKQWMDNTDNKFVWIWWVRRQRPYTNSATTQLLYYTHTLCMSHSVLRELPNCFWTGKKRIKLNPRDSVVFIHLFSAYISSFLMAMGSMKKNYINTKIPLKFFREFENIFNNNYTFVRGVTEFSIIGVAII